MDSAKCRQLATRAEIRSEIAPVSVKVQSKVDPTPFFPSALIPSTTNVFQ